MAGVLCFSRAARCVAPANDLPVADSASDPVVRLNDVWKKRALPSSYGAPSLFLPNAPGRAPTRLAGDEAHMEALSTQWKLSIEKMELLKKDPQEFVRRWGPSYKLSVEDVRGAVAGQSKDTQESRGPPSFFTDLWIFIQRVNYFLYVCLILWGVYLLLSE